MKKTTISMLSILFIAAAVLATACREGGAEQTNAGEAVQDTVQTMQDAVAAPVDSLATELDATSDEIEHEAKALQSALDSL